MTAPCNHESTLLEAEKLVHGDRNADYGHPLDDFSRTAKMWSAIFGHDVTAEQVGLCMMCVKISRECNRPKRDNMVDAAGYAETVEWCKNERYRREVLTSTFGPISNDPQLDKNLGLTINSGTIASGREKAWEG